MGTIKQLIDQLQAEDLGDLESMENADELQNFIKAVRSGDISPARAEALIRSKRGNPLATPVNSFRSPLSAATFDLLINRATSNILAPLPVAIFGVLDRESDYADVMRNDLPPATTFVITNTLDGKGLRFTYTQGANVDIIDVQCNEVPYKNLLRASQGSLMKMQQNKLNISDVAMQSQFSQKVKLLDNSMFGNNKSDTFTPNQFKSDLQNQNDMRTIDAIIDIDQQKSILINMVNHIVPATPLLLTITSFIQKFDRSSAQGF